MRLTRDSNSRRPVDIARQLQHLRLVVMLDPEVPLRHALSQHSQRSALSQGALPLSLLAGRVMQVNSPSLPLLQPFLQEAHPVTMLCSCISGSLNCLHVSSHSASHPFLDTQL